MPKNARWTPWAKSSPGSRFAIFPLLFPLLVVSISGCKKPTSLLYKMEMDFGDLQIIGLSRIFIQIIGLSLFSPDYRISTR